MKSKPRPWYFNGGTVYPQPAIFSKELGRRDAKLVPSEDPKNDRFENQLMFIPPNYEEVRKSNKTKLIAFVNNRGGYGDVDAIKLETLRDEMKCPVWTCIFSNRREVVERADFVIFSGQHSPINLTRTSNQIYAFYRVESPVHYNTKFESRIYLFIIVKYNLDI